MQPRRDVRTKREGAATLHTIRPTFLQNLEPQICTRFTNACGGSPVHGSAASISRCPWPRQNSHNEFEETGCLPYPSRGIATLDWTF
jgi:hypothetical protein